MDPPEGGVEQLLASARAGSREALGEALQAYRAYLLLIAQQELDPELRAKGGASDLVQETFVDAQRLIGTFEGTTKGPWAAWLREPLLNNLADFVRRYRKTGKRRVSREVGQAASDSQADQAGQAVADTTTPSMNAMATEQTASLEHVLRHQVNVEIAAPPQARHHIASVQGEYRGEANCRTGRHDDPRGTACGRRRARQGQRGNHIARDDPQKGQRRVYGEQREAQVKSTAEVVEEANTESQLERDDPQQRARQE